VPCLEYSYSVVVVFASFRDSCVFQRELVSAGRHIMASKIIRSARCWRPTVIESGSLSPVVQHVARRTKATVPFALPAERNEANVRLTCPYKHKITGC
jgi:hypothetical protein